MKKLLITTALLGAMTTGAMATSEAVTWVGENGGSSVRYVINTDGQVTKDGTEVNDLATQSELDALRREGENGRSAEGQTRAEADRRHDSEIDAIETRLNGNEFATRDWVRTSNGVLTGRIDGNADEIYGPRDANGDRPTDSRIDQNAGANTRQDREIDAVETKTEGILNELGGTVLYNADGTMVTGITGSRIDQNSQRLNNVEGEVWTTETLTHDQAVELTTPGGVAHLWITTSQPGSPQYQAALSDIAQNNEDLELVDGRLVRRSSTSRITQNADAIETKADRTYVDDAVADKADRTYVDNEVTRLDGRVDGVIDELTINTEHRTRIDVNEENIATNRTNIQQNTNAINSLRNQIRENYELSNANAAAAASLHVVANSCGAGLGVSGGAHALAVGCNRTLESNPNININGNVTINSAGDSAVGGGFTYRF